LLKKDFSDIDEKMQDLLQNPEKARRIADNNAAAFRDRYMTPAAISCYWRAMFRAWASVSFEPDLYGKVNLTDPDTCQLREQWGWRGQSWEKYMYAYESLFSAPDMLIAKIGSPRFYMEKISAKRKNRERRRKRRDEKKRKKRRKRKKKSEKKRKQIVKRSWKEDGK
jgi:hypothetical protein